MHRFLLSAALLPLAAGAAVAGNITPVLSEPAPIAPVAPAPVYEWSGPYVGAQLNYAKVQTDGLLGVDGDGVLFGLRAGYDLDLGRTVVGGLVQYDTGSIDIDPTGVEVENVLRIGGRVGYKVNDNLLAYGLAGYTQADTNVAGDTDGVFAGVGVETFVSDNVTIGAETIYHDFGDLDSAPGVDAKAATVGVNVNFRF